ncbi:GIY-YIG nuclease family protein [Oceanisphaera sp. KMM 10153]|uniref:GIY-YIG nuclease family protein n=1 Tax=Oceanisphaera submarina TaxID=3390193 RepID=UPI003975D3B3
MMKLIAAANRAGKAYSDFLAGRSEDEVEAFDLINEFTKELKRVGCKEHHFVNAAMLTGLSFSVRNSRDRRAGESFVYAFKSKISGLTKIGTTKRFAKRSSELASMSPDGLSLIMKVPGDSKLESTLHRKFANLRKHGEWFLLGEVEIRYMLELCGAKKPSPRCR